MSKRLRGPVRPRVALPTTPSPLGVRRARCRSRRCQLAIGPQDRRARRSNHLWLHTTASDRSAARDQFARRSLCDGPVALHRRARSELTLLDRLELQVDPLKEAWTASGDHRVHDERELVNEPMRRERHRKLHAAE